MIEIQPRKCRIVRMGNDAFNLKLAVIANYNGITQIYGLDETDIGGKKYEITEKDFVKVMPVSEIKKEESCARFISRLKRYADRKTEKQISGK